MCVETQISRRKTINLECFEKLASTSDSRLSGVGDLYRRVVDKCNRISGKWSHLICDVSVTADYYLLARVEKNPCGRYGVFVDATVGLQLLIVFSRLLGHPKVLEDIKPVPLKFKPPALLLLDARPSKVTEAACKAPQLSAARSKAAASLSIQAMEFLFMHEVGHIDGRHCEYRDTVLLIDPSTRKGFEHLADWFALRNCLARASRDPKELRLLGFSIEATLVLLGFINSYKKADMRYYPSPATRSFICEGLVSTHFPKEPSIKENVARGIQEAREAWNKIGWPLVELPSEDDVRQAFDDIAKAECALRNLPPALTRRNT